MSEDREATAGEASMPAGSRATLVPTPEAEPSTPTHANSSPDHGQSSEVVPPGSSVMLTTTAQPRLSPTHAEASSDQTVLSILPAEASPAPVPTTVEELNAAYPLLDRAPSYYSEAKFHSIWVVMLIIFIVGVTDAIALGAGDLPSKVELALIVCIHGEALIAFGCYFYLLFGDPGEIRRTEKSCFPMPDEVKGWMEAQSSNMPPAPLTQNVWGHPKSDPCPEKPCTRHIYCIRCFVGGQSVDITVEHVSGV